MNDENEITRMDHDDDHHGIFVSLIPSIFSVLIDALKMILFILFLKSILNALYLEYTRQARARYYAKAGVAQPKAHPIFGLLKERLSPQNRYRMYDFIIDKMDEIPDAPLYHLRNLAFDGEPKLWTRNPGLYFLCYRLSFTFFGIIWDNFTFC